MNANDLHPPAELERDGGTQQRRRQRVLILSVEVDMQALIKDTAESPAVSTYILCIH